MALVSYLDIQEALNIDLTDPNGQSLATSLIASAVAFMERQLGYPLEERQVTEYFDGSSNHLWLSTAGPVSGLTLSTYNASTLAYDSVSADYLRHAGTSELSTTAVLSMGFQSVKATYTTGWTSETLPADLKRAIIDLVGLKLQEVTNYSSNPDDPNGDGTPATGSLKRVSAGGYSEEYDTGGQSQALWKAKAEQLSRSIGATLPAGIEEVLARYRVPFVL